MKKLILASDNKHKLIEIKEMLEPLGYQVVSMEEIGFTDEIIEDGKTFKENSLIKAKTIFDKFHMPVIADDSGLIVDALNGPGIHSHRYAGENASDKENRVKLLFELSKLKDKDFPAHFTTAITYIDDDRVIQKEGYVYGHILDHEVGENGFGYDSLFYSDKLGKTLAEATPEEKNSISHRHDALMKLVEELK